jgi:hypothetical protein
MTDLDWLERAAGEYQPHQDTGYDHPEEVFFPEILLPPKAREGDYETPATLENQTIQDELSRREQATSTWFGKGIV